MEKRFITTLIVRVGDLNYGGHLANDKFLTYFHEARVRYLTKLGVSEKDIGDGVALTQVEAHVLYRGEAFLGDEISVSVSIKEFSRARFATNYDMHRLSDGKLLAEAKVVLAGYDYQNGRPQRIPKIFVDKVNEFQSLSD